MNAQRPIRVWYYRHAWRAACTRCGHAIQSDDRTSDWGWPDQTAAIEAATAHCDDRAVVA